MSIHDVIKPLCASGDLFMIAFLLSLLSCCWQVSPVPAGDGIDCGEPWSRGLHLRDEPVDLPQHQKAVDIALMFIV
jgi:hypothetical protein